MWLTVQHFLFLWREGRAFVFGKYLCSIAGVMHHAVCLFYSIDRYPEMSTCDIQDSGTLLYLAAIQDRSILSCCYKMEDTNPMNISFFFREENQ